MLDGPASAVDFVQTDIASTASTIAAFAKPWHPSVAGLQLTVFHTAAVIIPSERSQLTYSFIESVNVRGTENVLSAAKTFGADVFVYTSSASISLRPIEFWVPPWDWTSWPRYYAQLLDEADFFRPLRPRGEFYANYSVSKAAAERIVCGANEPKLRTGSIRPAHGIYGNVSDNNIGAPLNAGVFPA